MGQGYATEAAVALVDMTFDNSDATTIAAILEPANQASKRVLQKLGFRLDGQYLHPKRHIVHDLLRGASPAEATRWLPGPCSALLGGRYRTANSRPVL
jgi:RimJ/RimL family protein N-acetyltransferase